MKYKSLFALAAASLTMLFACEKPVELGPEEVTIVSSDVPEEIPIDGGEYTVELKATLDWTVQNYEGEEVASWLSITPSNGKASADNQTIAIKVSENPEANRSFDIVFYGDIMHKATLTIFQQGPEGEAGSMTVAEFIEKADTENEYVLTGVIGDIATNVKYWGFTLKDETGTISCPFIGENVDEFLAMDMHTGDSVSIKGVYEFYSSKNEHQLSDGVVMSHKPVSIDGIETVSVSDFIAAADPFTMYRLTGEVSSSVNTQYCSFDLKDDTGTIVVWTVNNASDYANTLKKGDMVTLRGAYMWFEDGSKHEVVDATIEKVEAGETPVAGTPEGSGTAEDPYNVAAAYKFIDDGQYYGDADNPNVSPETYVKGVITSIEEVDTGQYGNATYVISDGEGTAELEVFRGYYLNGEKFTSKDQIEVGDEVVVVGQLTRFFETYEFTAGSKIYSLNGQTSGGEDPDPKPDPGEVGTEENPYDVISALAAIDDNGWSNNNGSPDLYVKGIISSIDEIDTGQYGNATYYISDDGSRANELMVFRGYYIDGEKFTSSDQIKVGDEVVVVGSLMKYYNDYEFTSGSRIVSHKDNGGVEPVGPDIPEDALVFDLGSNYQTWSEATDATYGGGFETTVDGITLGYYKYGNNNDARAADPDHIRVYKGSAFRVKSDKNITNIILFCTGSGYCENLSPLVGGGSYSVDSSTLTIEWTGSASEIVAESAEAQVRFNKIAIVCE